MQTYVSFLRGVNVGGRIVKMTELKDCYEQAGFTNVATFIQSGNVTFDSDIGTSKEVEAKLEEAVSKRFNFPANILVYKKSELLPLIESYPFDSSDKDFQHYVLLLRPGMAEKLVAAGTGLDPQMEAVALGDGVVYWRVKKGFTLKTPFAKLLTKAEFKDHTNRNINTLRKLA